jgi:hypothetical protein
MPDPRPGRPALEFALLLLLLLAGPRAATAELSKAALAPNLGYWFLPLLGVREDAVLVSDGADGVFLTWTEASSRLWIQHFDARLAVVHGWPPGGRMVGSADEWTPSHESVIAADGEGGAYVAWYEDDSYPTLRVLRLGGDGAPAAGWPASGVKISAPQLRSTLAGEAIGPVDFGQVAFPAIARTDQGVVVAWMCATGCFFQFRIQKLDARGGRPPRWPEGGVVLAESRCYPTEGLWFNHIVDVASDDRGGAFALWSEARERFSDVKLVRVSRNGAVERRGDWVLASHVAPNGTLEQDHPRLTSNGRGEALIVWTSEGRGRRPVDLADVLVDRVFASSSLTASRPIAAEPWEVQGGPRVVADGSGGAYVGWNEPAPRASTGRLTRMVRGNRIARGWPEAGFPLGAITPWLVADRQGVLAVSNDGANLIVQRFDESGRIATGWPSPGRVITGAAGKIEVHVSGDGNGGLFLAWEETSPGHSDLIVAHWSPEPIGSQVTAPLVFAVHEPHPNPTAGPCRIEFDLPGAGLVDVEVFDVGGRRVTHLAQHRNFEAGPQTLEWRLSDGHGRTVSPGIYFVRVTAGRNNGVRKILVVR